jgi:hypothetical protein
LALTCSGIVHSLLPAPCHLKLPCFSKCWCQYTIVWLSGGSRPYFSWNVCWTVTGNLSSPSQ